MRQLDDYRMIALKAARIAGGFLAKNYGRVIEMEYDGLTGHCSVKEDKESDLLYKDYLKQITPEIGFYTEEGKKDVDSELVWAIDSLDGTSNYRMGLSFFATQISLLVKNDPVVCVIYNPVLGQEYTAIKGEGAFLNGEKIFVSDIREVEKSMLLQDKGVAKASVAGKFLEALGDRVRTARMFGGSTGMDLALVASGRAEITINPRANIYDFVPGVLLVREAGGVVFNLKGEEWTINDDNLVASNKYLMPKVLEIIKRVSI